jgi:hypothetical protein
MRRPTFVPIGRVTPETSTGIAYTLASARPQSLERVDSRTAGVVPGLNRSGSSPLRYIFWNATIAWDASTASIPM